ncbi:hypothetical protein H6F90_28410 [Trichocoleus sp. FACHB-591]|uniref:hypothetical protein n=1 Tax=unclassified Trichocoleus TaxID=2628910 RepID=UPI001683CD86|nr:MULTISPECIES: hypothetical protein [unclassified Trichocoleus]MBD2098990.1 hypothetical protein [Trichocoleus sp. FACHB-591]MBD2123763.1 hypothetical protein [Trichocoleus sp. FACHB-262]
MTPLMLRQLWAVVESAQAQILLNLDDSSLAQWLLRQLKAQRSLDSDETNMLNAYIHTKMPLIRDLAEERLVPHS